MKINFASLAIIAENLGILLADGIEISYAMELLLELQINKEYKKELINIKKKIIEGDTLYNSFRCSPMLFPDFFTGLIMLGEQSGEINRVLISLNKYYEKMDKIKKEIISATIYPIILLGVILLISVIAVFYVIPNLYEILKSINKEMPTFIIKMYNFNSYFLQYKIFCITFFISYFILIPIIIYKCFYLKIINMKFLTKIKIIKYVYEYIIILFFSVIIESGLSISLGIDTCIKNSNMKVIKKEFISMDSKIIKGMRIADAFENSDILSKSTKSMIKIGEEAGNLDTIINKLEVRLSSNLEKQINNFIKRLQPITICIMAIIVCVFIVIFILPIFDAMYIKV